MAIKLFITGGTIDCERIEGNDKYIFEKTYLPTMLKQGRCNADINLKILMLKDSIYTTSSDRKKILQSCKECKEDKIIVTHGTDSMVKTAQVLGQNIKNKTIILL